MERGRPIEFGEADSFEVKLSYPTRKDLMEHRHRAKKALDMEDKEVPAEDLEALRWVREKKGVIELGKPYTISRFSEPLQTPYKEAIPERPVTVEVPVFWPGTLGDGIGQGKTLREAVEATKAAIKRMGPLVRTYPEYNTGLDRVLLKVGEAEVTVSTLCALIRDYYDDDHGTGGALHCVLDDGNMEGRPHSLVRPERQGGGLDRGASPPRSRGREETALRARIWPVSKSGRGVSRGRAVGYRFEGDFDETPIERLLTKAQKDGLVTEFDTGRGRIVWFNGYPGAALRELRDKVERLVKEGP